MFDFFKYRYFMQMNKSFKLLMDYFENVGKYTTFPRDVFKYVGMCFRDF